MVHAGRSCLGRGLGKEGQRRAVVKLGNIPSTTVALFVAALLCLVVGTYTENNGFQAAGLLLAFVTAIIAINQARAGGDSGD